MLRKAVVLCVALVAPVLVAGQGTEPFTFTDLMKVRSIEDAALSSDGAWVVYALEPDRGDGRVVAREVATGRELSIERGSAPVVSEDSRWLAAKVLPTLEERVRAEREEGSEKPEPGLEVASLETGERRSWERVQSFALSEDGRWLALLHAEETEGEEAEDPEAAPEAEVETEPGEQTPPPVPPQELPQEEEEPPAGEELEPGPGPAGEEASQVEGVPQPATPLQETAAEPAAEEEPGEPGEAPEEEDEEEKEERLGTTLRLVELASGREVVVPHVTGYGFDEPAHFLAYAVAAPAGEGNGLYLRALAEEGTPERALTAETRGRYEAITWLDTDGEEPTSLLAFTAAVEDEDGIAGDASVWVFDGETAAPAIRPADAPGGWFLPVVNELAWSDDGRRLFFGVKPEEERYDRQAQQREEARETREEGEFDPYDVEAILDGRRVDVWHGDDPLIVPHQKKQWEEEAKRVYRAVLHRAETGPGRVVPLATRTMRNVPPVDNPRAALSGADVPYLEQITWDGWYSDVYWVSLETGERKLVAERLEWSPFESDAVSLSPDGRYVAWYRNRHWYLFDSRTGESVRLTDGLAVPFANEDHDYPSDAPGYGVAGWEAGDRAVLIYDKYDLWRFPTGGGEPVNVTAGEGRRAKRLYRVLDLEPEEEEMVFAPGERLLLSSYHDLEKSWGFWEAEVGEAGVRRLVEEPKVFTFLGKAADADRILYTREDYDEFPDLWTATPGLAERRQVSEANPELDRFAWGTSELVSWRSPDGDDLQGVLIKPAGYQEGERVPVLVYFYRFFSQRLHEFNPPHVNHRPSFPVYASDGYAIFLPDVRFEVGRPGLSAVQALTSGVQELVDMGVADPNRIGLHGHSWSGYQAAFVVTRTNAFAAAVAGAPVSNMTSAYTGIRLESGLARMFQYEKSQSRLGASLWDGRDLYVDNSPVFFADRIDTPLLIQFGDEDGAVPWQQGIELYLAMRRLGKEVVFLQYRGEGHHLDSYANKLDYSIKMKEFFDHHLKGEPAPAWMVEGVPYRGE